MTYNISYDSTKYIDASVEEVVFTLILTFVLVILVCYLFLQDVRSVFIPAATIPVSLAGTFAVMLALGYSINMFTLFALVLAIGLVVDDAIVVIERVIHLMQQYKMSARQAAIQTMQEVSGALMATSLDFVGDFCAGWIYGWNRGTNLSTIFGDHLNGDFVLFIKCFNLIAGVKRDFIKRCSFKNQRRVGGI